MFYYIINGLFFLVALSLIFLSLFSKNLNIKYLDNLYQKLYDFSNKHYKLIIFLLFILTIFTSTFKLESVPYGMHVDEAGMAYDAYSISSYGVDRYLNYLPVYLINYGGGQSALYAYIVAVLIKLFNYSIIVVRTPAVIFRLLIFISSIFILKSEKSKIKSLLFLLLIAICPYFIMQSRWGLDCNLFIGTLTLAVCLFIQYIMNENKNKIILLFSGALFGLALYTYALSYIIIPILLFFTCIYLLYIKKINIIELIILGIPIFILAFPLILMILVNMGYIKEIRSFITIPQLISYRGAEISLSNIFDNLYILLSILSFDKNSSLIYNSIPYFGTLYYFSIPFLVFGFINCLKSFYISITKKTFNVNIIFTFWFFSILICQLLILEPNINKANGIFIPLIYFVVIGITQILQKLKLLILPILVVFIINFSLFFNYYFYHYDNDNSYQYMFATHYLDAIDYSKNLGKSNIYIEKNLTSDAYIYILLNNFVSPYEFNKNNIITTYNNKNITYNFEFNENLDYNSIYIIKNTNELFDKLKNLNFNYTEFGNLNVFYYN